jgi:hypothetical protein
MLPKNQRDPFELHRGFSVFTWSFNWSSGLSVSSNINRRFFNLSTMAVSLRDSETIVADDPVPPPLMDRGLVAWLQVLGSWILFMNTW